MAEEDQPDAAGGGLAPGGGRDRPVVVGEVLFDVFPDGSRVLGGAPFNVAWHLQAFGLGPLMVSRVGSDAAGERVREAMANWGMDAAGIQLDPEAATGEVKVTLEDGEPSFEILPDRAWDRIDGDLALEKIGGVSAELLYHGSLITRSETSRSALRAVRDRSGLPTFIDVNLRDPWWERGRVLGLVAGARWVKLNQDELIRLAAPEETPEADSEVYRLVDAFARDHDLEQLVLTRGGAGATVRAGDRVVAGTPPAEAEVVDTVGAGDAFSAVWVAGLMSGWSPERTLSRALAFAATMCTVRGATTDDRELYRRVTEGWREEPV